MSECSAACKKTRAGLDLPNTRDTCRMALQSSAALRSDMVPSTRCRPAAPDTSSVGPSQSCGEQTRQGYTCAKQNQQFSAKGGSR
eukprot:222575-Chlamydomonas_euryale.AAC.2